MINLDITCSHCQSHAHIHAEVANIASEMLKTEEGKNILKKLVQNGSINEQSIKDEDITALRDELTHIQSVEDLLK